MKIKEENKSHGGHRLLLTSSKCNICHDPPEWLPGLCSCCTLKASFVLCRLLCGQSDAPFIFMCITSSTDWGSPQTSQRNFSCSLQSNLCYVSDNVYTWWKKKDLLLGEKVIYYVIKEFSTGFAAAWLGNIMFALVNPVLFKLLYVSVDVVSCCGDWCCSLWKFSVSCIIPVCYTLVVSIVQSVHICFSHTVPHFFFFF